MRRNTIEKVDHSLCFTSSSDCDERNFTPYQIWYVSGTGRVPAQRIYCLFIHFGGGRKVCSSLHAQEMFLQPFLGRAETFNTLFCQQYIHPVQKEKKKTKHAY